MSHWNYRIVKLAEDHYALCEVYYNKDGKPDGRTDARQFDGETPLDIITDMEMALKDAKTRDVLVWDGGSQG